MAIEKSSLTAYNSLITFFETKKGDMGFDLARTIVELSETLKGERPVSLITYVNKNDRTKILGPGEEMGPDQKEIIKILLTNLSPILYQAVKDDPTQIETYSVFQTQLDKSIFAIMESETSQRVNFSLCNLTKLGLSTDTFQENGFKIYPSNYSNAPKA